MALLFSINPIQGSFIEKLSFTAPTVSNVTFSQSEKGLVYNFASNGSLIYSPLNTIRSIEFILFKTNDTTLFKNGASTNVLQLSGGLQGGAHNYVNNGTDSNVVPKGKWVHIVVDYNTNQTIDRIVVSDKIQIGYINFYDTVLTASERGKLYAKFVAQRQLSKSVIKNQYLQLKSEQLSESGLVAAYNMKLAGGILPDISGNGKDLTAVGMEQTPDGGLQSRGNGSTSSLSTATPILNNATVWTVCYTFENYKDNNSDIIIGNTGQPNIWLNDSNQIAFRESSGTRTKFATQTSTSLKNDKQSLIFVSNGTNILLYVNGVFISQITPTSTSFTIYDIIKGYGGITYTPSLKLLDCRIYNVAKDAIFAKNYYNQFRKIGIVEDFSMYGVGSSPTRYGEWIRSSGSWAVQQLTANSGIKKKGEFVLKCTGTGRTGIPIKPAYGLTEIEYYKNANTNSEIWFSTNNLLGSLGYGILLGASNEVRLRRLNQAELFITANSYTAIQTFYKIRIYRTGGTAPSKFPLRLRPLGATETVGTFMVTIQGGAFTNETVIVTSGGSGNNPSSTDPNTYTTSKYFVISGIINDMIGNIKTQDWWNINEGIIVDTIAPTATITYSVSTPVKSGTTQRITATFNEAMADSPIVKIALSGSNTLAATNMTKTDSTHYYYDYIVGSGDGTCTVTLSVGTDIAGNVITSTPTSGATFTIDNTAPTNQNTVFASNQSIATGSAVTIVSSGDTTNNIWFAPNGTTVFIEGTTMTKATNGIATSILAPATAGDYRLYVIDAAGNISSASTAILTATASSVVLIDSYSETNVDTQQPLYTGAEIAASQCFLNVNSRTLDSVKLYLRKVGTPTGTATVSIYAMTGSYGTTGAPTGSALATSDALTTTTLSTSYALTTFNFTGANRITLSASTYYCIVIQHSASTNAFNDIQVGYDGSSPTHGGNMARYTSSWTTMATSDMCFYIYGI